MQWLKANPAQITAGVLLLVRVLECVDIALKQKPKGIIEFNPTDISQRMSVFASTYSMAIDGVRKDGKRIVDLRKYNGYLGRLKKLERLKKKQSARK